VGQDRSQHGAGHLPQPADDERQQHGGEDQQRIAGGDRRARVEQGRHGIAVRRSDQPPQRATEEQLLADGVDHRDHQDQGGQAAVGEVEHAGQHPIQHRDPIYDHCADEEDHGQAEPDHDRRDGGPAEAAP
jgi:hypothetical protein